MQPTHQGQAYIRFRNVYDKEIEHGPFQFGDISISFVDHNKGHNWRAVNFNRECWLLLLGFLPDYREDVYVVNSISSFGRVLSWVDDENHMSRVLVRARVIDYESVPQFIVMTEGEGFRGNHGRFNVRFCRDNCLEVCPKMRTLLLVLMLSPQGGLLTYLVLVKLVLVLPISQVILVVDFLVIILKWN
jgi:hypothetical protein